MIGMEHLHRHPPAATAAASKLNAVMNPLVLTNFGNTPDNYSLSSGSTSAGENSLAKKLKTLNQGGGSVCNSSSVGDTSSAASSIDFLYFSPTKEGGKTLSQTLDQGISLTTSTISEPGSLSRPTTTKTTTTSTINAQIDEFVASMINTAKELSTFSANDCSQSSSTSVMSKSLQQTHNFEKYEKPLHPRYTNNSLPLKSENIFKEVSTSPDLSGTKVSVDELSTLSEVDSLIKELDEAPSTHCNRPQGGTPKFLKMDDQYTTNSYVSLVRGIAEKQTKQRCKDDALNRTTSWAANLLTTNPPPPPLPVASVPSTPIMSRYRIMNSSMKVSPDYLERNDTPTSTKSADNDGYFLHHNSFHHPRGSVHKKLSNLTSKFIHGQRFMPMSLKMNHPTSNNSEASLTRSDISDRQVARFGGALTMRNAAFDANATLPFIHRIPSVNFMNLSAEKPTRIDELLDYDSDYLYDIQTADKIHVIRDLALHEFTKYLDRSVGLRLKHWTMRLELIRNFRTKFIRPPRRQPIVKHRLFGMPLHMIQAQNGNRCPFPQLVMDIMDYLKENAKDVDGIFRKPGAKTHVDEMRAICDTLSCYDPLPEEFKTLSQVNDLCDLLKQYLRAIPQQLISQSLSETTASAITAHPSDKHLDIMKLMTLIMPDENRDALFIFLDFLLDISKNSVVNLMTVDNISTCTVPSVFYFGGASKSLAKNSRRKTIDGAQDKALIQYHALKTAFSVLISYRSELDTIPVHILKAANMKAPLRKKKRELKDAMPPIGEIGAASSLRYFVAGLFKEYDKSWPSWHIESVHEEGIVLSVREVDDSCSLKSCRVEVVIPASPQHIFAALINHREKWDLFTTSTNPTFINYTNKEDIAHVTYNNCNDTLIKKATVARVWEENEAGSGRAFIAEKSCKKDPFCVNVEVYHSAFIIVPSKTGDGCFVNHISRIDLKGKSTTWYEKTYRQLLISQMTRLLHLFKNMSD